MKDTILDCLLTPIRYDLVKVKGPGQHIHLLYMHSNFIAPKSFKSILTHQIPENVHVEGAHDTIKSLNCVVGKLVLLIYSFLVN